MACSTFFSASTCSLFNLGKFSGERRQIFVRVVYGYWWNARCLESTAENWILGGNLIKNSANGAKTEHPGILIMMWQEVECRPLRWNLFPRFFPVGVAPEREFIAFSKFPTSMLVRKMCVKWKVTRGFLILGETAPVYFEKKVKMSGEMGASL